MEDLLILERETLSKGLAVNFYLDISSLHDIP
jgi:hypothetical protein